MGVTGRVEVVHPADAPVVAQFYPGDHAAVADFCAAPQRIRNMGHQGACFGADFAALQAETTIDTVGAIAMGAGQDRNRAANAYRDIQRGAAFDECVSNTAHGMRPVGIAMRMTPRIVRRPGDGHFQFELLVVRLDVGIRNRPVCAHTIARIHIEVRGMEPRGKCRPVDRAAAYALTTVVGS